MTEAVPFPVIDMKATGKNIERLRRQAGITVRGLQEYFCFEYPQAIYKWQWGESIPSVDNLLALSRLFNVTIEDILVTVDQDVFAYILNRPMTLTNIEQRGRARGQGPPRNTIKPASKGLIYQGF